MASASPAFAEAVAKNASSQGILSVIIKEAGISTGVYVAIATAIALFYVIGAVLTPRLDAREPPIVKPTIPLVGHIVGLLWYQAKYHVMLRRRTRQPIATLPMLTGKMYAIWDPALIAAGFRSKSLSTTPQVVAVTQGLLQVSDETDRAMRGPQDDGFLIEHMARIVPATLSGANLQLMNQVAMGELAADLNRIHSEKIPNVWLWLRRLLTLPTTKALYGDGNPFAKDPHLEDSLWSFESNLPRLISNFLPSLIAPAGHRARAAFGKGLGKYYAASDDHHSSASEFLRARAKILRELGIPEDEIGRIEIILPFVAMVNTIPSLFWFFCFVFSNAALVQRLREQVEKLTTRDGDEVIIKLGAMEEHAPLLLSCYREVLRLTNHQVSTRTVMQDTVLSDSQGNSYLLKKGAVVQMAIIAAHTTEEIWGQDVDEFNPDRFLNFGSRSMDDRSDGSSGQKDTRAAFLPFGGGIHYCPGRNFAYAELMATMSVLLLGFDVEPLGGEWKVPGWGTRTLIDSITKPAGQGEGLGVQINRREAWRDVKWKVEM